MVRSACVWTVSPSCLGRPVLCIVVNEMIRTFWLVLSLSLALSLVAFASNPLQVKTDKGKVRGTFTADQKSEHSKEFPTLRRLSDRSAGSRLNRRPNGRVCATRPCSVRTACSPLPTPT